MKNVIETVLYTVSDKVVADFMKLNTVVTENLSKLEGFDFSNTYQAKDNKNLILDIVRWDSLKAAKKAAEYVESDDKFRPFLSAIQEVKYFGHAVEIENSPLNFRALDDNDTLEFALFYTNENSAQKFLDKRVSLMNYIAEKYPQFKQIITLNSTTDSNLFIDIASWENAEICHRVQKELENDPLFIDAFQHVNMEKELIMEFFSKIR